MIVERLALKSGECIAVVGAGGKTSLCWLLLRDLAARSERVIFSTTTRVRLPQATAFDAIALGEVPVLPPGDWRTACIASAASAIDGQPDGRTLTESLMPVVHTKLAGYSPDQIDAFFSTISTRSVNSPISLLIEADGARGLMLKAPATYEPNIPSCATTVCVVANLDAVGQPLDERVAHRPERIAQITGVHMGMPIDGGMVATLLAHPEGGLKGIPANARRIAVLMQRDEHTAHPDAAFLVQNLVDRGYAIAIVLSPRAHEPRVMAAATP